MTPEQLWQAVLGEMELSLSKANFTTWLKNTAIISEQNKIITVGVPNGFTKEWLENKYNKKILNIIKTYSPEVKEINYIINPKNFTPVKEDKAPDKKPSLNLEMLGVNPETNLNPKYTIDSFVVGSSNELAYAAALSVIKKLGTSYNPLFVYGGVGLGKTHLLQAIGNEVLKTNQEKRVKYVSSEKFTTELVNSISNHDVDKFKENYRKIDVLILDDVQFLSGKEKTQEEFFHIFNALYEKNKQIVLSSDRPPKSINKLEERLCSRFEGGMIADIISPDFETRLAILKKKIEEKNIIIPDEVLSYIASNIKNNIRELEGALNKIIATYNLKGFIPSLKKVSKMINITLSSPKKIINPKQIIKTVADFYNISEEDIINKNRKKEIVKPRQVAMYLLREEFKNSYPSIGCKFGGRDHTTAIHACEKIKKEIQNNNNLEQEVNIIKERLFQNF